MKQEHKMETLNNFSNVLLEMPSAGLRVFLGDVECQFDTSFASILQHLREEFEECTSGIFATIWSLHV